jgi:transcriptional regulator with XRE-family HTH domain
MNPAKRRKLEAAGWRVGTVAEYFNLSAEEAAYIELRVRLSEALKERRSRSGFSQVALATALGSSQSRVAKMEASDPSVTIDLLIKALLATGAGVRELSRIVGFDEPKPIVVQESKVLGESGIEGFPCIETPWIASNYTAGIQVTLP